MGTLGALKQSNAARYGTYGLVVLWYVIFTLGTLFQFGFGGAGLREQATRLAVASVAFIVLLALIRWFFETQSG